MNQLTKVASREFDLEMGNQRGGSNHKASTWDKDGNQTAPRSWFASYKMHTKELYALVHNQSKRDIQAAIQNTVAFVCATFLAFKSGDRGPSAWFLTVLAPLLMGDSLGSTLLASRGAVVNFTPAAILIYVLQILGMGYHSYTSTCIVFVVVCFWMGYVNPSMGARKIALLLPAVILVTIVNTPNALLTDIFIWEFLEDSFIAVAVDIAISFVLIPRYASFEVTERFHYALRRNADVLELIFNAMLSNHKAESEIYLCEADELLLRLQENQDTIGMRAFVGSYEPVTILRSLFRSKQLVYNQFALSDFQLMNSTMFWHISSLAQAVREINFNEYHANTWSHTRSAFQDIAMKYHAVVVLLGNEQNGSYVQEPMVINAAIVDLKKSCDHMYWVLSKSMSSSDKNLDVKSNPQGTGTLLIANLFFAYFNIRITSWQVQVWELSNHRFRS